MQINLKTFNYDSGIAGTHLLITGAVHGNEVAGPEAIRQLMTALDEGTYKLKSGQLTFIPVCNEEAYRQDVRFVEQNLNRVMYQTDNPVSYEEKIAQAFIPHIHACDAMLDIHSTHEPGDPAFSFMDENHPACIAMAKATGLPSLLVGWENVYEGEDFTTEAYANRQGKPALTVECGYHKEPEAIKIAWRTILNTLIYFDIIDADPIQTDTPASIYRFIDKVMAGDNDRLAKQWKHMDPVQEGDILYYKGGTEPVASDRDGYILIPNGEAKAGMELYYFGIRDSK